MATDVRTKRIYDPAEPDDGYRVLIDHIWPRGVSRERARLDDWSRDLAPSDELRKWFGHDPGRLAELRARAASGPLTILYAARDREHNNAAVLSELLREG